jgi:hypothetical protein
VAFFAGSAATKSAATAGEGVPLDEISDDEEDPYDEEDEEDIDLEDFEEEDQEDLVEEAETMSSTPGRKKQAPAKKSSTRAGESPSVDKLSSSVSTMKVSAKLFSMDFKLPYIIYVFNQQLDEMCNIDIFAPTLPSEFFIPDVTNGGNSLELRIQVPPFFVCETRVLQSNQGNAGFNENTSQAQAFKNQCEAIDEHYAFANAIFSDSSTMTVELPFTCEERITSWEVIAYLNDLGSLTDDLGGQQFHSCVSITLTKLKTKRRTAGGFRVVP